MAIQMLAQADVTNVPRFANLNPFMRATYQVDPVGLDIAMLGIPFDSGSSFRSGSRHGPAQVREMSRVIRQVHYPSMLAPFEVCRIADVGDAPVNPLYIQESLQSIESFVQCIHEGGALPLAVGGDHTVTLPILRTLGKEKPLSLVQIDAHSDTLDTMLGKKYANGTPIRRAIEEGLVDPQRVVQVGIRGTLFKSDDLDWAKTNGITIIDMMDFHRRGLPQVVETVHQVVEGYPTYLTFDIDSLDPAYAPGTGGVEPGGLTVREAQLLLRGLGGVNFIGADLTEVSPPLDPSGNTALVACNLMFEQLCLLVDAVNHTSRVTR